MGALASKLAFVTDAFRGIGAAVPSEIANVDAFPLSDAASFMTAASGVVDGGVIAAQP